MATTFDVFADFNVSGVQPAANNPFTYGTETALNVGFTLLPLFGNTNSSGGSTQYDGTVDNYYFAEPWQFTGPSIAVVAAGDTLTFPSSVPLIAPDDVLVMAAGSPEHAAPNLIVTRFTAPSAGLYDLAGSFTDLQMASVGLAIVVNGTTVFNSSFTGNSPYQGTISFSFDDILLEEGATIDFVVDSLGSQPNDVLGLKAKITESSPLAYDDAFATFETNTITGNVFADNGSGPDTLADDGSSFSVIAVNGNSASVGAQITLASGALLTVNADGSFDYDPNHAFDFLPAPGSGASNTQGTDTFDYSITGGSTATVTITVTGTDSNDLVVGAAGLDILIGGIGSDIIDGKAAADHMSGGPGDDTYIVDNTGDVVVEPSSLQTLSFSGAIATFSQENRDPLEMIDGDFTDGNGWAVCRLFLADPTLNETALLTLSTALSAGHHSVTFTFYQYHSNPGAVLGDFSLTYATDASPTLSSAQTPFIITGATSLNGQTFSFPELGQILASGPTPATDVYTITADINSPTPITGIFLNVINDPNNGFPTGGPGRHANGNFEITELTAVESVQGTDLVKSSVTYVLPANVENLVLVGIQNINGTGNELDNAIAGNLGDNILDGGPGNDGMIGGTGNDTYFVDTVFDQIGENAGEGIDTVYINANYALGANVEQLYLQESAGAAAGVGNGEQNLLVGNSLGNVLDGGANNDQLEGGGGNDILEGGSGNDGMIGGPGNDTYFVDSVFDVIIENAGEGIDTVYANSDYILGANVEQLYLLQSAGAATGVGNGEQNLLVGNSFDNTLDGGANNDQLEGGAGNDILEGGIGTDGMIGGTGNDSYFVDSVFDVIVESAGEGIDTVYTNSNYIIGTNVEQLYLLESGGAATGVGNGEQNLLVGNSFNNALDGGSNNDTLRGGSGDDTLFGGSGIDGLYGEAGNDNFVFNPGTAAGDVIVDFAGNGAAAGDMLSFVGFGAGATFTQQDATHGVITYNGGVNTEVITFQNAAAIDGSDYQFL